MADLLDTTEKGINDPKKKNKAKVKEPKVNKGDIRKQEREAKRIQKLDDIVDPQAAKFGIDLDNLPKTPVTDADKQRITQNIKQTADREIAEDIEAFGRAYAKPTFEQSPVLSEDELRRSAKKERRAKWADALYIAGQGGKADPEKYASTKLRRDRDSQFQNFRTVTEKNKKTKEIWENQYRKDLLAFINKKMEGKNLTADQKAKYAQMKAELEQKSAQFEQQLGFNRETLQQKDAADKGKLDLGQQTLDRKTELERGRLKQDQDVLAARKSNEYYDSEKSSPSMYTERQEDDSWQMTTGDNPYSDLMYKLSGDSPEVLNEFAKRAGFATDEEGNLAKNLDPKQTENLSNTLVSQMYDVKKGPDGRRIATPKPGMETYLDDISNNIRDVNQTKLEIENLGSEKYQAVEDAKFWNKNDVREEYDQRILELQSKLDQAEQNLNGLVQSGTGGEQAVPQASKAQKQATNERLDNFFN